MQHNKFFDEMTKTMSGAVSAAFDARRQMEESMKLNAARTMRGFGFVPREEVEAIRAAITAVQKENEALKAEIAQLEKKLSGAKSAQAAEKPKEAAPQKSITQKPVAKKAVEAPKAPAPKLSAVPAKQAAPTKPAAPVKK